MADINGVADNWTHIPVVDFSAYSLDVVDTENVNGEELKHLAQQVYNAFSTVGFAYLKNHGIHSTQVERALDVSRNFFELPSEVKDAFQKRNRENKESYGYVGMEGERLNPQRPADLKEMYNVIPGLTSKWPDKYVPEFRETSTQFFNTCTQLTRRILEVLALALDIQDRKYFINCHKKIMKEDNYTCLRYLYYPILPDDRHIKTGQVRLGEHSDYGTMTLLFQDDIGGLEVKRRDGTFIPATPIPGTILVNISDAMQRWTADKLVSTVHRVLIPEGDMRRLRPRQSMAFFVNPDNDTLIECFDGSDKYKPILHSQYIRSRFGDTYTY